MMLKAQSIQLIFISGLVGALVLINAVGGSASASKDASPYSSFAYATALGISQGRIDPPGSLDAWKSSSGYDWLQFGFDSLHSGNNTLETQISKSNVSSLIKAFQVKLPTDADGAPAYLSAVITPHGVHDLLFFTTKSGDLYALDAQTGAQVWWRTYPSGTCRRNDSIPDCYTTSSPVIDPNRRYVYYYGLDGYVRKYNVGDGTEVKSQGWPEVGTLKPYDEKGSSALSFATAKNGTTYLYVVHAKGGLPGDGGEYQGHLTAINLADGSQRVFNSLCSDQPVHFVKAPGQPDCPDTGSGIWARPGVVYDPDIDKIFLSTGNGNFLPGSYEWGDSVFELNPDGTGANGLPLDSYTPTDYQYLEDHDLDLGSTGPAILPAPPDSHLQHLAVQGGKDANLRLLNLDNLSGQGGPGHTGGALQVLHVPRGGEILTQPAVWVNPDDKKTWVFVSNGNTISGLQLVVNNGAPSLVGMWQTGPGGSSPMVANGVLFVGESHLIRALDPLSGSQLWSSGSIGEIHWGSPIVANGMLYIPDAEGYVTAFKIP